ncbi:amidase [Defluviimonas sp. WL0075]|uniref:Amidase n=1 Tax=Albidovulum sediminicola TaxID=2984331 RepID=A0ABT2Z1N3_9RHOB|nr:amidase [Defluviimonas sp. WL0075]MCV2864907.1 amidase [Defluviimonas sp. WL0075]
MLTDLTATELSSRLAARDISAAEVMAAFLDRIEAVNPAINALVSLRPRDELMAEARAADEAPRKGWLHGIPFATKELVETRGMPTTQGSPIFRDHVSETDDLLAARIRAAGAVFIGKTNVPEWGLGSHSFNPVFGTTLNPYDRTRSAGGSSGGAAAALATRLVPVADGSDTMGSLRNPAAFCNVYGFRPSFGRVPQDAIGDTFLTTISTAGPMARTIEDLARLLEVISGPHAETPFGLPQESFADRLERPVKGKRIGWLADWGGAYATEPGILEACESALGVLEEQGAIVERLSPPFPAERIWDAWVRLRAMLNSNAMRALYDDPAKRAALKPEAVWEIEQGLGLAPEAVYAASVARSEWYAAAHRLFARYDAMALPAAQVWPFPADWRWPQEVAGRKMDTYHRWMEVVIPVSLIGLPSLCVPAGFGAGGLPTGLQLIGPHGADAAVLALGQAYHQATDWPARRPPAA